jgi:hypothetical protein
MKQFHSNVLLNQMQNKEKKIRFDQIVNNNVLIIDYIKMMFRNRVQEKIRLQD